MIITRRTFYSSRCLSKAANTQGAVLLQSAVVPLPAWPFTQGAFCEWQRHGCRDLKGTFTQGTASPAGGLLPKLAQQRQRRCKLARGPNLLRAAKLPAKLQPTSVKMPVEINWIQLTALRGSTAPCVKAALDFLLKKISWKFFISLFSITRSRPNWIAGQRPKSGSRGPENGLSRWRWPNSQNDHFGLVYDVIQ